MMAKTLTVVGVALAICAPAIVQARVAEPAETETVQDPGDIVVTARRRSESLQDVPISVTALSGDQLAQQNISSATQLAVPSLTVTVQATIRSLVSFAIRGQRSQESQLLTDPPVGTYFAEVVQPRPYGFGNSLYDIQSVQVLKGVQGTLFGRNMTGGAVLVEPNHPTDEYEGEIRGQIGNFNLRDFYAMGNFALAESVAVRIAGKTHKREGFSREVTTGRDYDDENYDSIRASLMLRPAEGVESLTIFDYYKSDEHGTAAFLTGLTPNGPLVTQENLRKLGLPLSNIPAEFAAARALFKARRFSFDLGAGEGGVYDFPGTLPRTGVKNWGIQNKTTVEIGDQTLKNIVGYREVKRINIQDYDGIPAFLINPLERADLQNISEELQLQGSIFGDRLDYTIGAFYFEEKGLDGAQPNTLPELTILGSVGPGGLGTTPAIQFAPLNFGLGKSTTYAAYAAGTYKITDELSFSGGLRYNYDKREATVSPRLPFRGVCNFDTDNVPATPSVPIAQCSFTNSKSWSAITWDATLQYEPSDATTLYVATRKGFRAGGYSLRAASEAAFRAFDPETVQEYEAGLKNVFDLGVGRLRTSAAIFYQDYSNVQKQNPTGIDTNGDGQADTVITVIVNTAKQENFGGEFDASLAFDNGLTIGGYVSYVKVNVKEGLQPGESEMRGVPKYQAGFNLTWQLPVPEEVGVVTCAGSVTYQGRTELDDYDTDGDEPAYALAKARLSWDNIYGSGIGGALFVNNIFDKLYRVGVLGLERELGFLTSVYGEPRNYGLELSVKF